MIKSGISVQELRARIAEKAKAEPTHRFWGLYTHVCKPEVLREAYCRLSRYFTSCRLNSSAGRLALNL